MLPLPEFGWRLLLGLAVLVVGFVASSLGGIGAGDVKFAAAAAPLAAYGDWRLLVILFSAAMLAAFATHRLFGEEIFFLVCCLDYPRIFEQVYPLYRRFQLPEVHLSREKIAALHRVMRAYLDRWLLPKLDPDALNVIGFTTTFAQVFASILAIKHIREHSDADVLFVFGGASMALPETNRALHLWGVAGWRSPP